jgi:glycosyltransferase involved in cell wall biosynthesis
MQKEFSHCFALCAYQVNPNLEECVQTLLAQTLKTKIIMITGSPNDHISSVAKKYNLPLYANPSPTGMAGNWNYAYKMADADYVTITHEDDLYDKEYAASIAAAVEGRTSPLIIFSDYYELNEDTLIRDSRLLNIKRRMNLPFRVRAFQNSRFIRNRVLSIGCSICCPSVTFHKSAIADFKFDETLLCNLDWDAWYRISKNKGSFIYIPKPLMIHRIHEQSETTKLMKAGIRQQEDLLMFKRYWPDWIAGRLLRRYNESAENNELLPKAENNTIG